MSGRRRPYNAAVIPCGYLRVYRPLETFPEEERARWERYILSGGAPRTPRPVYRHEAVTPDGSVGLLATAQGEQADIRLVDGKYFVCPWRLRLRILSGILTLRDSVPADLAETFVKDPEARRAARELAKLKRQEPAAFPCILQSPWHVPVHWFVLVDDDDRRLVETGEGAYRLYYWTSISHAKRRLDRTTHVLRRTELIAAMQAVRELSQWLSVFDPASRLELDYAELSRLFTWDELDSDHSGREIQSAVEVLAHPGGLGRAGELYQGVVGRWAEAKARESLN